MYKLVSLSFCLLTLSFSNSVQSYGQSVDKVRFNLNQSSMRRLSDSDVSSDNESSDASDDSENSDDSDQSDSDRSDNSDQSGSGSDNSDSVNEYSDDYNSDLVGGQMDVDEVQVSIEDEILIPQNSSLVNGDGFDSDSAIILPPKAQCSKVPIIALSSFGGVCLFLAAVASGATIYTVNRLQNVTKAFDDAMVQKKVLSSQLDQSRVAAAKLQDVVQSKDHLITKLNHDHKDARIAQYKQGVVDGVKKAKQSAAAVASVVQTEILNHKKAGLFPKAGTPMQEIRTKKDGYEMLSAVLLEQPIDHVERFRSVKKGTKRADRLHKDYEDFVKQISTAS